MERGGGLIAQCGTFVGDDLLILPRKPRQLPLDKSFLISKRPVIFHIHLHVEALGCSFRFTFIQGTESSPVFP